jgi:Putative MetA-pathway of phenol degradation
LRRSLATACLCATSAAFAGPPYVTDDPVPTDRGRYEIYTFAGGSTARDGSDGAAGVDFNYGAATDLQLTAVAPFAWSAPDTADTQRDLGNVELAAKYRFLHQDDVGIDVAVFPRVFLPAGSSAVGTRHTQVLLPIWLGRSEDRWSTFGGGGCVIDRGNDARDFCIWGWAATLQVLPDLQVGTEVYHQTADARGGRASTNVGVGATYDLGEHLHLMASAGPTIENSASTSDANWYVALLITL